MMDIKKLLQRLKENEIDIVLQGADLEINFDGEELPAELLIELRSNKLAIIQFLKSAAAETTGQLIPKVDDKEYYELSSAQKRLWVLSQFDAANVAYNIPGALVFKGQLNMACLKKVMLALIGRHEILRTAFLENERGEVKQYIKAVADIEFDIENTDLRQAAADDQQIEKVIQAELVKPFNLEIAPLIRVRLLQTKDNEWIFVYVMHHIVSDGWSMRLMMNEMFQLYNSFLNGKENPLQPLRIQYRDYSAWQQEQLQGELLKEHKKYWLEQFNGDLPVLELPADRIRPVLKTYNGKKMYAFIENPSAAKLKTISQQHGGTLFMGLLAALNVLLYRYTGQEDIIIGSPSAGRDHADLEDQLGYYINTLAFRSTFSGNDTFSQILEKTRAVTLGAYEHQVYPFDELIDELKLKRDISRSALFDVMLVLQNTKINTGVPDLRFNDVEISGYEGGDTVISKFDLLFNFSEMPDGLQLELEYNTDLFDAKRIERMALHLDKIIEALVAEPAKPVGLLSYLSAKELQELKDFNGAEVKYPEGENIISLMEAQVLRTPDATALVFEDKKYSYSLLNETINAYARYIQTVSGVKPGTSVCVITNRSEWSVIAMISILKLGCVYIPIDKLWPESRIMQALEASGAKVVISDEEVQFPDSSICVIPTAPDLKEFDVSDLHTLIAGDSSSYIIYTSGSSGVPKGVEQTYKMLYNLIKWEKDKVGFLHAQKHLQFSSFSFDSSLADAFYAFSTGGELHVLNEDVRKDLWSQKDYILENAVSTVSMPYAALKVLFDEFSSEDFTGHSIKEIISTGEQLYVNAGLRRFLEENPEIKIFNLYGPSETHVVTGLYYTQSEGVIPVKSTIGKPVDNTDIYILDRNMQLVPKGVEGEIYIGGMNLAAGYNGRKDLTDEKFIPDPFRKEALVYKSGDIAKWLEDGQIEYMGRKDNQVKINGYRIETEEIELAIRSHPSIHQTVVLVRTSAAGEKMLAAYIVLKEELDLADLRIHISKILPQYMLPPNIIKMETFPLNANGKVDKKILPSPDESGLPMQAEYVAPVTDTEKKLAAIWATVLGNEKIGIRDNFFESGGHSLKATVMLARIRQEFGIRFTIEQVFVLTTIEKIAKEINAMLWLKNADAVREENENTESLTF
jgi:amino acid adenylation domain-containing protein